MKRKALPENTGDVSYGGCLIDLDRAKAGSKCNPIMHVPTEKQRNVGKNTLGDEKTITCDVPIEIEDMEVIVAGRTFQGLKELNVQKDIVQWAGSLHLNRRVHIMQYALSAVTHAVRFDQVPENGICSATNLYWHQVRL